MIELERRIKDVPPNVLIKCVYVTVGRKRHPIHGGWEMVCRGLAYSVKSDWDTGKVMIEWAYGPYPHSTYKPGKYMVTAKNTNQAVPRAPVFESV